MKSNLLSDVSYSKKQISALTIYRVLVGWHFLYEGLIKLFSPNWSSISYLNASIGPLAPLFKTIAQSETLLMIVDLLNIWGLILIGLSLFLGLFSYLAKISGIFLLTFYYISYPPFPVLGANLYLDGNYWIVNRNLIEIAGLFLLLVFPSSRITGLDRFIFKREKKK